MGFSLTDMIRGQRIVGGSLCWDDQKLTLCLSTQEEDAIRILALREATLEKPEPKKIQSLLKKWQIPKATPLVLSLASPVFQVQKIELPTLAEENTPTLLIEKLQERLDSPLSGWDYRLMPLESETESGDIQEYLVYLMELAELKAQKQLAKSSGLKIKAGEAMAVALGAWFEALTQEEERNAALIYFRQNQIMWVGIVKGRIQFCVSLSRSSDQTAEPYAWTSEIHQVMEDFLLSSGLEELSCIYLAGNYASEDREQLSKVISVPLKDLAELNNPLILFEEKVDPKLSGRFAAELGASLFPKRRL